MPNIIEFTNLSDLLARYQAGESELELAREFKVSRNVIRKRLLDAGITPRSMRQAQIIRASKMSIEDRQLITAAAHAATRGRHRSITERSKGAITRQTKGLGISPVETMLVNMLTERGFKTIIQQKAIGTYNIDIAIESCRVAIEIYGGHWHSADHHALLHAKRTPYILNSGWNLVIIWVDAKHYPLGVGACDYIAALCEKLRFHKPTIGQYHVIRGNGNTVPILSSEFNCLPTIKSSINSLKSKR